MSASLKNRQPHTFKNPRSSLTFGQNIAQLKKTRHCEAQVFLLRCGNLQFAVLFKVQTL